MALPQLDPNAPDFTRRYVNLADARLGAKALSCSDDFFAEMGRMLNPEPAVFIPGKYDSNGKWMDGWESRRKRVAGHDWCVVRLARPGLIRGVDLDTSHFTGNYPPATALEGCDLAHGDPDAHTEWFPVLAAMNLGGNAHHYVALDGQRRVSHLRVNLYPDGGLARLRVYGVPDPALARSGNEAFIYVDAGGDGRGGRRFLEVPVATGPAEGGYTAISPLAAFPPEATVAITGVFHLRSVRTASDGHAH